MPARSSSRDERRRCPRAAGDVDRRSTARVRGVTAARIAVGVDVEGLARRRRRAPAARRGRRRPRRWPRTSRSGRSPRRPRPTPSASSARWSAAVAELRAIAWRRRRTPRTRPRTPWSCGPVVSQPESRTSRTAARSRVGDRGPGEGQERGRDVGHEADAVTAGSSSSTSRGREMSATRVGRIGVAGAARATRRGRTGRSAARRRERPWRPRGSARAELDVVWMPSPTARRTLATSVVSTFSAS